MASREGEERGQSSLSAPSAETAESDGNQQQRLETPPITMMQPPGANSPANNIQQQHYPGGDQTALFNMLRAQVEYYFSPQNLGRDSYLRNMLTDAPTKQHHQPPPPQNVQLMTPIEVIANFPKVWNICASFGAAGMMPEPPAVLLNKALRGSTIVTISSEGAWIGPTSQQLPPFTGGSAPPSPSPSHHGPPATIAAVAAPPPQFQQSPYNMSPYPPPQMMMIPMQQPDGTILHQSFPPPYYMGGPPPPLNSNNNNRPLSVESISPSSASLEDAGSIPSQMKESSKISDASLSSLSEQQQQQQPTMHAQQQPPPPQYGGPMMGQQQQQYPMPPQQFLSPPYGVPMHPYPPYYNPQQQQQMPPPNFMPPPGVRYGGPPPPPPRGYHPANGPPPPYPYPGMMPPPPPPQFVGDGYPPPHPHGYPPRHQPNVGDTHRKVGGGGGGGSFDGKERGHKKKKKNNNFDRKRGNDSNYGYRSPNNFGHQQQQNYGGGGGGASSSSPHYNNRYPKQYAKKGGDATNEQQNKRVGEKEVVLNPFDFPGLDGKAASDLSAKALATVAADEKLVGYASALLKKNEKGNGTLKATATSAADPSAVTSPENEDDNTMAQQTEAMEKEILSEFHDLSIRESDTAEQQHINDSKQYDTPTAVDKTDGHTVETSPSSTENGVVSPQSATNENSPTILPDPATKPPTEQNPRVDLEEGDGSAPPPPPPAVEQQKLGDDNQVNDNKEQNTEVEKPKAPAAWGSKRLFADVVASQK